MTVDEETALGKLLEAANEMGFDAFAIKTYKKTGQPVRVVIWSTALQDLEKVTPVESFETKVGRKKS